MTIFLTSSFNHFHIKAGEKIANEINNTNQIINQIKDNLKDNKNILYIFSILVYNISVIINSEVLQ